MSNISIPGAHGFSPLFLTLIPLLLASCSPRSSTSADFPNRSIELIVPWAAGGGTDRVARFLADALQRRLGKPVIVVNRTGGSGAVGHSAGALAPADGYTLTMGTFELSTMHSMGISKLTWQNFTPVAQVNADAAALFVRNDASWRTLGELLDAFRAQPGKLKMSGTATGGAWDLARSGLLLAAGQSATNVIWVPTQGAAPALVELLGGHVDVVCCSVAEALSQLEGGQIRLLAVLGPERLADFPNYPTAREQGVAYDGVGWRGILLPASTPAAITKRLSDALADIARSREFAEFMKKNGFAVKVRGPEDFKEFLQEQDAKWAAVIRSAGYDSLGRNHDPGPRMMPWLLLGLFGIALVAEVWRSRRQPVLDEPPAVSALASISPDARFAAIALVLYLAAMPWVGFACSTVVFALVLMLRLGTRWWLAAASSVVLVAVIHLLFVTLFKVQLP